MQPGRQLGRLPQQLVDKVRTGVTLNSVSQAVAELLANALDACSSNIVIKLSAAALTFVVEDDGMGLSAADLDALGGRYCTSKLRSATELQTGVQTLGFRGEAVSSLLGLAGELTVTTRAKGSFETLTKAARQGGADVKVCPSAMQLTHSGTIVTVKRFLFNQPVRQRQMAAQEGDVEVETVQAVMRMALPFTAVNITLLRAPSGQVLLHLPRGRDVRAFFLRFCTEQPQTLPLLSVTGSRGYTVRAALGALSAPSPHTHHQLLYVNRRYVVHKPLSALLNEHFLRGFLKGGFHTQPTHIGDWPGADANGGGHGGPRTGRGGDGIKAYPAFLVLVECPHADYDVTAEPDKTDIVFRHWPVLQELLRSLAAQAWGPGPGGGSGGQTGEKDEVGRRERAVLQELLMGGNASPSISRALAEQRQREAAAGARRSGGTMTGVRPASVPLQHLLQLQAAATGGVGTLGQSRTVSLAAVAPLSPQTAAPEVGGGCGSNDVAGGRNTQSNQTGADGLAGGNEALRRSAAATSSAAAQAMGRGPHIDSGEADLFGVMGDSPGDEGGSPTVGLWRRRKAASSATDAWLLGGLESPGAGALAVGDNRQQDPSGDRLLATDSEAQDAMNDPAERNLHGGGGRPSWPKSGSPGSSSLHFSPLMGAERPFSPLLGQLWRQDLGGNGDTKRRQQQDWRRAFALAAQEGDGGGTSPDDGLEAWAGFGGCGAAAQSPQLPQRPPRLSGDSDDLGEWGTEGLMSNRGTGLAAFLGKRRNGPTANDVDTLPVQAGALGQNGGSGTFSRFLSNLRDSPAVAGPRRQPLFVAAAGRLGPRRWQPGEQPGAQLSTGGGPTQATAASKAVQAEPRPTHGADLNSAIHATPGSAASSTAPAGVPADTGVASGHSHAPGPDQHLQPQSKLPAGKVEQRLCPVLVGVPLSTASGKVAVGSGTSACGGSGSGGGSATSSPAADSDSLSPLARFLTFASVGSDPGALTPDDHLSSVRFATPTEPRSGPDISSGLGGGTAVVDKPSGFGIAATAPPPAAALGSKDAGLLGRSSTPAAGPAPDLSTGPGVEAPPLIQRTPLRQSQAPLSPEAQAAIAACALLPGLPSSPTRLVQSAPPHAKKRARRVHGNPNSSLASSLLNCVVKLDSSDGQQGSRAQLHKPPSAVPGAVPAAALPRGTGASAAGPPAAAGPPHAARPLCTFFRSLVRPASSNSAKETVGSKPAIPPRPGCGPHHQLPPTRTPGAEASRTSAARSAVAPQGKPSSILKRRPGATPALTQGPKRVRFSLPGQGALEPGTQLRNGAADIVDDDPAGSASTSAPLAAQRVQPPAMQAGAAPQLPVQAALVLAGQSPPMQLPPVPNPGPPGQQLEAQVLPPDAGQGGGQRGVPGGPVLPAAAARPEHTTPPHPAPAQMVRQQRAMPIAQHGAVTALVATPSPAEPHRFLLSQEAPSAVPAASLEPGLKVANRGFVQLQPDASAANGTAASTNSGQLEGRHASCMPGPGGGEGGGADSSSIQALPSSLPAAKPLDAGLGAEVTAPCLDLERDLLRMAAPGEVLLPKVLSRADLASVAPGAVMAQVDRKFIPALASDGTLLVVDQHAAHERVRLEQLTAQLQRAAAAARDAAGGAPLGVAAPLPPGVTVGSEPLLWCQPMAAPVPMQLAAHEAATLARHAATVAAWGWQLRPAPAGGGGEGSGEAAMEAEGAGCGGRRLLTAVPVVCGTELANPTDLRLYLNQLGESGSAMLPPPAVLRVLRSKACRTAVMFGDTLLPQQREALLAALRGTALWSQCAHGRPTAAPLVHLPTLAAVLKRRRAVQSKLKLGLALHEAHGGSTSGTVLNGGMRGGARLTAAVLKNKLGRAKEAVKAGQTV
ncbi:hypothetical protein HYH03_010768 [Edaphochlamys debaryana]|uniref:MutL C-terminal dimerisation domain-containing protein n=1 Tax=Edaphochlamys debaryana TaxID=47281 RepID=A0A835Y1K8_9CHLO|nr:hypothetical protein HYH03_010768 [Edaphochlamys debaryana]|eukprot:KAG2490850.1 hypothetical protein HYH03_010768 [Edaphochlamys debaryana]